MLIQPRVFNGIQTFEQPAVGLLLRRSGASTPWRARCSLTLIRPGVALTAAHYLCDGHGSQCQPGGVYAPLPGDYRVLLQTGGVFDVSFAGVPYAFDFPDADYAVLALLDDDAFLCWESDGGVEGANNCMGDSGAPVLIDTDDGLAVAALVSGGYGPCDGEDLAFATALGAHAPGLASLLEAALAHSSSTMGADEIDQAATGAGWLGGAADPIVHSIQVAADATRLVAIGNGADAAGNSGRLRLAYGEPPTAETAQCNADLPGMFKGCTIDAPMPGVWSASYDLVGGPGGEAQLSLTSRRPGCGLDIDADGRTDALSDGLLLLRYLAGRSGAGLVDGALGVGADRVEPSAVRDYLARDSCIGVLDVDADGVLAANTDGELVLRYLLGFRGAALVRGVPGFAGADAAPAVEARIRQIIR